MAEMEKKIGMLQQENERIKKKQPNAPAPSRRPPPKNTNQPAAGGNVSLMQQSATATINTGRIMPQKNLEETEMTKDEKSALINSISNLNPEQQAGIISIV